MTPVIDARRNDPKPVFELKPHPEPQSRTAIPNRNTEPPTIETPSIDPLATCSNPRGSSPRERNALQLRGIVHLPRILTACLATLCLGLVAQADFVVYRLPGTQVTVLLEGKTKGVGQGTFEYTHPSLGTLTFSHETALVIKAPTKLEEYRRLANVARQEQRFDDYIQGARFALRSGFLEEFRECCNAAYKIQPDHPTMLRPVSYTHLTLPTT
jgi:hypothetical protein